MTLQMDRAIEKELELNAIDKKALEAEIENYRVKFADEVKNGITGIELHDMSLVNSSPLKMRKPCTLRFKEIINNITNKLKIVLGC